MSEKLCFTSFCCLPCLLCNCQGLTAGRIPGETNRQLMCTGNSDAQAKWAAATLAAVHTPTSKLALQIFTQGILQGQLKPTKCEPPAALAGQQG